MSEKNTITQDEIDDVIENGLSKEEQKKLDNILKKEYPILKEEDHGLSELAWQRIHAEQMKKWKKRIPKLEKEGKSIQEILSIRKEGYPLLEMLSRRSECVQNLLAKGKSDYEILSMLKSAGYFTYGVKEKLPKQRREYESAKIKIKSIFEDLRKKTDDDIKQRKKIKSGDVFGLSIIVLPVLVAFFYSVTWGIFIILIYITYILLEEKE